MIYILLILHLLLNSFSAITSPRSFDELWVYEGGGFTGMFSGYVVDGIGKVYQCEGKGKCSKSNYIRSLPKKQINELEKLIEKNKLLKTKFESPSNISRFILVVKGSKKQILIWNPFAQDSTSQRLTKIYNQILGIVEQKEK